ncbi:MAG: choice-of-anchor tandem repeat GloVer-containing protein, partial [Bacteroidales bacterium]
GAANGSYPYGSLISDGTFLYGMTRNGGTNNLGTLFKIMPDGTGYSKLLDFAGAANGSYPYGSLISDGTFLYGMTSKGGTNDSGTVFKIMPDGTGYSKLLDFAGEANGSYPWGSLISDGTFLYGMTQFGGTNNLGTLFKIMPDGTGYSKLLDFAGAANGSYPRGSLISDGTFLYGMTSYGGTNNRGTLFKIMPDGTGYSKLLDFTSAANGIYPRGSLISDGTFLYGMTSHGGTGNLGTIFKYCTPVTFTQSPTVCAGQSVTVGSNTYTTSGTYTDVLTSYQGCDSTVTTNLTVLPAITNSFTITPATCGNNNGSAAATPSGGAGTYTYSWSNGDTTSTVTGLTGQPTDTLIVTITDAMGCTLTDTAIIDCLTGIAENNAGTDFNVYPNPGSGKFLISSNGNISSIEIYNLMGEKVFQFTINNPCLAGRQAQSEIDLSNQTNGIYFIKIYDEQTVLVKKIVIQ